MERHQSQVSTIHHPKSTHYLSTAPSRQPGRANSPANIKQPPPFTIRLLGHVDAHDASAPPHEPFQLPIPSLLPASYRTESNDIAAPARHVAACVAKELDLRRLAHIHRWLWLAGRPLPPRPLHYQRLLSRDILVTEQMDMHLVWATGRIFLKPMPRFLLEPRFWTEYLSCRGHACDSAAADKERRGLRRCALGFLFSYAALIMHESDFFIAADRHLMPEGVTWPDWRALVEQLGTEHIYPDTDLRFYYGELRLSRLNKIYSLWYTPLRGCMPRWNRYGAYFHDNFAWIGATTVYIVVVLTAMQVGLATNTLADNDAFQSASYGFTVFSIIGPLAAAAFVVLAFCCLFVKNWVATVTFKNQRLHDVYRS